MTQAVENWQLATPTVPESASEQYSMELVVGDLKLNETLADLPRNSHIVEFYTFPVIFFVGTVCNILTFIVMRRKKMRHQSTYFYMAVLAIADEMVLIFGCLNFWLYLYSGMNVVLLHDITCRLVSLGLYATLHFSVWVVVIMTIERFIAVALPLQASHLCTVKRAKTAVILLSVVILLINSHFIITHKLEKMSNGELTCLPVAGLAQEFVSVVWTWIDGSIYSFIPLTLLVIFNILIVYNLVKASKNINKFNDNKRNSDPIAKKMSTTPLELANVQQQSPTTVPLSPAMAAASQRRDAGSRNLHSLELLRLCWKRCSSSAASSRRLNGGGRFRNMSSEMGGGETSVTNSECKPLTSFNAAQHRPTLVTHNNSVSNLSTCGHSNQQQAQQSASASRRLTIMLLLVSITFLITSMPIVTLQFLEQAQLVPQSKFISIVRGLFLILQYLNHSANFFLYAGKTQTNEAQYESNLQFFQVTGKTFRKEFFALLKLKKSKSNQSKADPRKNVKSTAINNNLPRNCEPKRSNFQINP